MPLYKQNNAAELAQSAMSGATQAMAAQTKATGTRTEKDSSVLDDIYKGAAAVAYVGRGMEGLTDAAKKATDLWDNHKLRNAYEDVDKAYASGGWDAVDKLGNDFWHTTATGRFAKDRAESEHGKLEMLKNMDAVADMKYKDIRPLAMQATQFYKSGNMEQFMPLMQAVSEKAAMPIRLNPTANGNFQVMFRSDEKGGWTENGTMTPEAAYSELQKFMRGEQMIMRGMNGELLPVNKEANLYMIRNMWNTYLGNADNRIDPKKLIPLYDKNGNVGGFGRIQNPLPSEKDPDAYMKDPQVQAFGINGQGLGTFNGYEGIMKHGLSPFAPKKGNGGPGRGEAKNGIGPKNTALNLALNQAGYGFDKTTNAYYALARDENGHVQTDDKGRPVFDYEEPLTNEVLSTVINRSGGQKNPSTGNRSGNDPLGILHSGNGAAGARSSGQQPPAPAPMDSVPQQANATPTYSGNYRANMDRQANTRRALIESGDYSTEIVGLPGLGINSGALVEGDSLHGQGMLSGIGMRTTPFGQTPTEQWRQHYRR